MLVLVVDDVDELLDVVDEVELVLDDVDVVIKVSLVLYQVPVDDPDVAV